MSISSTLTVTSSIKHIKARVRNPAHRLREIQQSLNLANVCVGSSDSEGDDVCNKIDVGSPTNVCSNKYSLWKINMQKFNMETRRPDDDVDQLVQMINFNSLQHEQHALNPKKAAKKARQKARKDDERRRQSEAEKALLEAEERKRLAEEHLERTVKQLRNLNISKQSMRDCVHMKENKSKNKSQEFREHVNKKETVSTISKGAKDWSAENRAKGLSLSNHCNSMCVNQRTTELRSKVIESEEVVTSTGKKKKRKKKNDAQEVYAIPEPQEQFCSHTCSAHPGNVPSVSAEEIAEQLDKKSKKAKKKARQQLRRAQLAHQTEAANTRDIFEESRQHQTIHTCNYGHPVVVNMPSQISFTPVPSSIQAPPINNFKMGNSHLDWNQLPEDSSTSPKPEMVTIRRHPTVSDTTVTISIKNQNGEEDVLYTLLNGQVVRSKPDVVDIDSFITNPSSDKTGSKKSKKKRNKKKSNKKSPDVLPVAEIVGMGEKVMTDRVADVVTCTPVLDAATACPYDTLSRNDFRPSDITKPRGSYSLFNELDDVAEIDLSKLKLPPGITITKVNQPLSSVSTIDKDKEMSYAVPPSSNTQSDLPQAVSNADTTPSPSLYYSDGLYSKPNVIVVDSQEYNADNESDADDFVGFKKRPNKFEEVVSVKVKRLRNRVNRYLYGDDPSDRQENIPEKILTPAQANMYMNLHMPNRMKQSDEFSCEPRPVSFGTNSATSATAATSVPTVHRSATSGSKRKQPNNNVSASRSSNFKGFQQPLVNHSTYPQESASVDFNFGDQPTVKDKMYYPFTNYQNYPTSPVNFQSSALPSVPQDIGKGFVSQDSMLNGYGNWTSREGRTSHPNPRGTFGDQDQPRPNPFYLHSDS